MLCCNRDAVSSDLVGRITAGGYSIRTDNDRLDTPLPHDLRGHGIADQRAGNAVLLKLPHGQSGPLKEWPCFVRKDMDVLALVVRGQDRSEGCSVF